MALIERILSGGNGNFFLIAGPCVVEGEEITLRIAREIKAVCEELEIPFCFKASYRKANRSSLRSFTGIGDEAALGVLRTVKEESSRYYSLKADLHRRYAMPFACFVFVLLAAPFGIFHTRAGMMKGVLTSIILCLGYFVVAYLLINLAKEGKVNAIVACWAANVVFLGVGAYLVYRMR